MLWALLLITEALAGSQQFPKTNKLQKFDACYNMLKMRQVRDSEFLKSLFSTFADSKRAESFYIAEVLYNCYTTIDIKEANFVIDSGNSLVLSKELEKFLDIDLDVFRNSELKTTETHKELYQEIKNIKSSAESKISSISSKLPYTPSFTPDGFSLLFLSIFVPSLLFFVIRFFYRRLAKWSKLKKH